MIEEFPMPAITEAKRQQLVKSLKHRLNMYQAILENQNASMVRPRGGLEANVSESILLTEMMLAMLTAPPAGQIFQHPSGKLFWSISDDSNAGQTGVVPYYLTPPVKLTLAMPDEKPPSHLYHTGEGRDTRRRNTSMERGWAACRQQAEQRNAAE